jgi:hypothetical protein
MDIQPMLPSAKGLRIAERNHLNYATSPAEMQRWIFSPRKAKSFLLKLFLTLPGLTGKYQSG